MFSFKFALFLAALLSLPSTIFGGYCTECECVHGKYAHSPIRINIGKRQEIAVKGPACLIPLVTYTWKAVNGKNQLLYDLGTTIIPRVVWHPFMITIKSGQEHKNNRIIVTKSNGITTGRCVCHIDFIFLDLYTHIDGSQVMQMGSTQTLTLRTGKTFDFMQPFRRQHLIYKWTCEPVNKSRTSSFCEPGKVLSTGPTLTLHGPELGLMVEYKIVFTAKSPTTGIESSDTVYIKVGYGTAIPLSLRCRRNCGKYIFNAGQSIYIIVECFTECGFIKTFWFYIDDVYQTMNIHGHFKFMPPDKPSFNLKFILLVDGIKSEGVGTFKRNDPPEGGTCTVTPTTGTPGDTLFKAMCEGWTDINVPIRYELKAEKLVIDQTTDPNWEIYVPDVKELTFIICDNLRACAKQTVPINLTTVQIPKGLNKIMEYMKNNENNIKKMLIGGEFPRAVVKAILMMKDQPVETDKYIVSQFKNFKPDNIIDVLQLGTMINQLMSSLGNLTSQGTEAFLELLDKMCDGFEQTVESGEIKDIGTEELQEISEEVVGLVSKLTKHDEIFTGPQSQLWSFEGGMLQVAKERAQVTPRQGHLIEHYAKFDKLNDTILKPINIRMHALCKTLELLHYIGVASSFRIHKGDANFEIDEDLVKMQTIGIDVDELVWLVSPDEQTTAILTVPMLKDMQEKLGGDDMTAQVVSFGENPFWWFPTEHPITTSVFYFSAFSEEDQSIESTQLDVPIKLDMLQERTGKQPPIIEGNISASNEMPIYRVRTPSGAAVIINFTNVAIDMDVLVKCKRMPSLKEVRSGKKQVLVDSLLKGVQYLYSDYNHANDIDWCYVALIASKDVGVYKNSNYTFTVEIYECLTWNVHLNNPTWLSDGCVATHEDENITCLCYHMSIFAGRSYYTIAEEVVRDRKIKESIDINWYLVAFYILLILILIWLFLRAYDDLISSDEKLVSDMNENERKKGRFIALHITTGGHWTGESSANVLVSVPYGRTYTITQDPEKPLLKPNTTCVLELPIKVDDLPVPPKIMISQDGSGRYPSWYCESIMIINLENDKKWHCTVQKWIGGKPVAVQPDKDSSEELQKRKAGNEKQSAKEKWKKIKAAYHDMFMCWFLFQPLFGPRQYGVVEVDRFIRSCIWIAKFAIIILLVFLYFGETNLDNYEAERYAYEYLIDLIDGKFVLFLILCYFITLLVELLLLLFIYPEFLQKFKKSDNKNKQAPKKKRILKKIIYRRDRSKVVAPEENIRETGSQAENEAILTN